MNFSHVTMVATDRGHDAWPFLKAWASRFKPKPKPPKMMDLETEENDALYVTGLDGLIVGVGVIVVVVVTPFSVKYHTEKE